MDYIDLHTHTNASDGSMSPAELVRYAKEKGLRAVAVTDHDTVDGLEEALLEGKRIGMEVIPGVEIGVDFYPEMHMLGYFLNGGYAAIKGALQELRERRVRRNPQIVRKLNEMGFEITMEDVEANTEGNIIGRPHIAKAMVEKGYAKNLEEAFNKYLAVGKPAYVKKDKLTPEEGIALIREFGGLPVLAHPVFLRKEREELDLLLEQLAGEGLVGLEVYYTDHTDEQTEIMFELAKKNNLVITGGTDFHGKFKTGIEIGIGRGNLRIPYELLEKLKEYRNKDVLPDL